METARGVALGNELARPRTLPALRPAGRACVVVAMLMAFFPQPAVSAGFGDMLGALAGSPGDYGRGRDLDDALRRLAKQINRNTPRNIDQDFRLDQVTAEPGSELVYHYTVLGRRAAELPPNVLNTRIAPAVREQLCENPQMLKLLDSGAGVAFSYRGNDGSDIGKVSFRQRDCGDRS